MRLACIAFVVALAAVHAEAQTSVLPFEVESADGATIAGQADAREYARRGVVVFVAGTGLFDRDVRFGRTGTPRDLLFADLARRMTARGLASVRYDRRGLRYGATGASAIDVEVAATSTTSSQREDLAAVYDWARAPEGLGARCVVIFAHSEGLLHVGRLAAAGASAPTGIIAMGGLLESPKSVLRWQLTERDVYSLHLMDTNGDGRVTNAEVEVSYRNTPSGAFDMIGPFLHPNGVWTSEDLAQLRSNQERIYEQQRALALAEDDNSPYPNSQTPMARYSWWKSWFFDDIPVASQLAGWRVPMTFHYGDRDSQVNYQRQRATAGNVFGAQASFIVHEGRGHSLGEHPLFGPIDTAIADQIADEAATTCPP